MARPVRVVIVDDYALVREVLTVALSAEPDIEVVGTAEDGEQAITVVGKTQPDVVVLDVAMPVLSGVDAMPRLRAAAPQVKVLMHTASDILGRDEAMKSGADAYVVKGAPADHLVEVIIGLRDESLVES